MSTKLTPRTPPTTVPKSVQYDFFTDFFGQPNDLSNTIELWDAIPKYSVTPRIQNKLRDPKTGTLSPYKQKFEYRPTYSQTSAPITCTVTIYPASVERETGKYIQYYPSTNEEILEEVLKKIFTDQNFGLHHASKNESWVKFTLYMLQKELKKRGHTRNITQIKESLKILSNTKYELVMHGPLKDFQTETSILSDLTQATRSNYLNDPKALRGARLPTLVSKSINELAYRQFNYSTLMNLGSSLARWLFKRLTHQYINANVLHPYNILFSSIKRDSGLLHHQRTKSNIDQVIDALEQFKDKKILMNYSTDVRKSGSKITDVLFVLTPTPDFVQEIKAANARHKKHSELVENSPRKK